MNGLLKKLERSIGPYAIPNLTWYLVGGQVILYMIAGTQPGLIREMVFVPELVMQGEVWRLFTFVFLPEFLGFKNLLWFIISMNLLWIFGSSLEQYWGTFRYNFYLGIGFLLSIAAAFAFPQYPASNLYVISTVFLAFALLNPDYTLMLFFVLPVKVKWLALLTWLGYAYAVVTMGWPTRVMVVAGVANFGLFFGRELLDRVKDGERRRKHKRDWERKTRDD